MTDSESAPWEYRFGQVLMALPEGRTGQSGLEAEVERARVDGDQGETVIAARYSLGAYMKRARVTANLSIRQAAKDSGISEGRWRQLESGYQSVSGQRVPIRTTKETVLRVASTVNLDPDVALALAGFDLTVSVRDTGVWPLPKHRTIMRDSRSGQPTELRGPHISETTLKEAKDRLRSLEQVFEVVSKLPLKDLEHVHEFVERLRDERYHQIHEREAELERAREQLERGY